MMNSSHKHFQLVVAAVLILSLALPLAYTIPDAGAEDRDMHTIKMYLKYDGADYYMNTVQDPQTNEQNVAERRWEYGWYNGNLEETQLVRDLEIRGTQQSNTAVVALITIDNPTWDDVDVTFELWDNTVPVAHVQRTLQGGLTGGESWSYWEMVFNGNADSTTGHTFREGHTMTVRMLAEGNTVSVQYGNDGRLEFAADQISDEEFHLYEPRDNVDMAGEYFIPRPPDGSDLGDAHIWGTFHDIFSFRDIDHVEMEIEPPDDGDNVTSGDIAVQGQSDGMVRFDWNWSYVNDVIDSDDAGTHYVTIRIIDNSGNTMEYEEAVRIKMNKYGAYVMLDGDEESYKRAGSGESVNFEFRVYNAGLVTDTIGVSNNVLPGDWTIAYDEDSLDLNAGAFDVITATVTIPDDAEPNDRVKIDVKGTSQQSEGDDNYPTALHSHEIEVEVTPTASIAVFFKESDSKGEDGDGTSYVDDHHKSGNAEKETEKDFFFRVRNDSPSNDTVSLHVKGKETDWEVRIATEDDRDTEIERVDLDPDDEVKLLMIVTPAGSQGAADIAELEITGVSWQNDTVEDTAYLTVERTLGVLIAPETVEELDALEPGKPNTLGFMITNTGNEDRIYNLIMDDSGIAPEGWLSNFKDNIDTAEVLAGESTIFYVEVRPPESAERKAGYYLDITAEADDNAAVTYTFTAVLNAKEVFGVEVVIDNREKEIDEAGGKVEYIVVVTNTGNSEVTINLETTQSEGEWNVQLSKSADIYAPGDKKEFILTVIAPDPVDNKEECEVKVTAKILGNEQTSSTQTTNSKVDKGSTEALTDAIQDAWWMLLLLSVVVLVAVILWYHSQQQSYEDEDDYYEEEDEEYDDWE